MSSRTEPSARPSEVAMWHKLSGYPDNVTDEGVVVDADEGRRLQSEKRLLHAEIAELSGSSAPSEARATARLAASYLVAGDVETARRYVNSARDRLAQRETEGAR
jgi:hypothetical protein